MAGSPFAPNYEAIVRTAVSPFCVVDHAGTIVWAADSIADALGWSPTEIVGRNMLEFVHPDSHGLAGEALAAADQLSTDPAPDAWESTGLVLNLMRKDGVIVPCDTSAATPARTGLDGLYVIQLRRAGYIVALGDTVQAMAEDQDLDAVLTHLSLLVERELPYTTVEIGREWSGTAFARVCTSGTSLLALDTGADGRRPWGEAIERLKPVVLDDLDDLPAAISSAATAAGVEEVWAYPVDCQPGPAAIVVWRASRRQFTLFSQQSLEQAAHLVDLTLRWDRGREALAWAATHDPLTGLDNRRSFLDEMRGAIAGAGGSVLYLDLDDFKPVNDEHGHAFGDKVLAVAAERLRGVLRPGDVVARIGGDEFAILCPGLDDPEVIDDLADRLIAAVSRPITVEGRQVTVGMSAGIASFQDELDPDRLLAAADEQLRAAKTAGKGVARRAQ